MITARTKKQLIVFAIITLLGISFVGARYAQLDRLFYDATYEVNSQFAESGGIFTGAEVTYRGVGVGKVSDMKVTRDGVDVVLSIENGFDRIPAQTTATVGNKSAVGEQYVELAPTRDAGPYLRNGSTIKTADTAVPVSTTELLTNLSKLVRSVPQDQLRTVVSELGTAFQGAGPSLSTIIDTSTSFIETANQNFDVTTALIRDAKVVLKTQADKGSAIRNFSRDLALFSGTLADNDAALRSVIDNGSATATELRTFLEQNRVNLGQLLQNLVTTGRVVVKHLDGIRQILILYPYIVAGGFTVAAPVKDDKGRPSYNASFGLVLTQSPKTCSEGYDQSQVRRPDELEDKPMNTDARCTDTSGTVTPRGAQMAPSSRPAALTGPAASPVATYDAQSGQVRWHEGSQPVPTEAGPAAATYGKDAWKWMLVQPSLGTPTTDGAE